MSTFYLDLAAGNDANDGSSWANAWKTFRNGATAARIAPGDTIRIAKTPDPVSLGVNATFTGMDRTAVLASALTANIDLCENVWTSDGGSDVVCSTQGNLVQGSYSAQMQVKAAFGTGLAAHREISEIDLSSYQNVSFYIYSNVAVAASSLRLDLCSDTAGATPVESITVTRSLIAGKKTPILYKKGSALASSVKSVALTVLTDLGGADANIRLDNIIAANSLHHCTMIGKSGGPYLPVRAIDGTNVYMGTSDYYNNDIQAQWPLATDTVAAYAREVVLVFASTSSDHDNQIQDSGDSRFNKITFAAGYDTGTTTQNGHTWMAPMHFDVDAGFQSLALDLNGQDCLEVQRLCFSGFTFGWYTASRVTNLTINACSQSRVTSPYYGNTYDQAHGMHFKGAIDHYNCGASTWPLNQVNGYGGGFTTQDKDSVITFYSAGNQDILGIYGGSHFFAGKLAIKSSNYYEQGLILGQVCEGSYFNEIEMVNVYNCCRLAAGTGNLSIEKLTVTGGTNLFQQWGYLTGRVRIGRYTQASGTPTEWAPVGAGSNSQSYQDMICFDHYKADNRWKAIGRFGSISDHITGGQDAAWAYGETGLSMLMNPNNQNSPLIYQFTAPVAASTAVKLHMQVRKTSSGANCRLFVNIAGAGCSVVQEEEVTLTDSWAEYQSLTFTPTRNGFVTVTLWAFDGSTTGDIGLDDIHIAAAA